MHALGVSCATGVIGDWGKGVQVSISCRKESRIDDIKED